MSQAIMRRSLTDQVYTLILKKMQSGELKPGDRLNIEELSKEFAVSRTPLREAISRLVQNGFVVSNHNVGPSVATYDGNRIADLIVTNNIIFEGIVKLIFEKGISEQLISDLQEAVELQEKAYEAGNMPQFVQNSILFHEILIKECPNKKLARYGEETQIQMDVNVAQYQAAEGNRRLSINEHRELIRCLVERNLDGFLSRIKIHNERPLKYFK